MVTGDKRVDVPPKKKLLLTNIFRPDILVAFFSPFINLMGEIYDRKRQVGFDGWVPGLKRPFFF